MMKLFLAILSSFVLVLASNVTDTFGLYTIKSNSNKEKEIGEALIPFIFQNTRNKIKLRGFTNALPGTDYTFVFGSSNVETTRDFHSELTLRQLIYIYKQEGTQGDIKLPSFHVELNAIYTNNLKEFDDRINTPVKDHVYSLKKGSITVKAIADSVHI